MNVISSGKRFDTQIRMKASRASATRILVSISLFVQRAFTEQTAEPIILLTLLTFVLFVGRYHEIADGGRSENIPQVVIQLVPAEILATDRKDASGRTDASTTTAQTLASKDASRRHTGDEDKSFIPAFASSDCHGRVPKGYARIFIADRADGKSGSGVASDPFDGSTAQKLDTLLRTRSEAGVTNLVVCIGPGTLQTEGTYDYVVGVGHLNKTQFSGFTVNRGWKVHGERMDRTILKLRDLYLDPSTGRYAVGHIISTYDSDSYGVEVSDLTLDDNYPALKPQYKADLQPEAVSLRSTLGQHWIHNVHVMNAAGEWTEAFPVEISSTAKTSTESTGNIVDHVTMDHWASGKCTAIAIANAVAEVRYNTVIGHQIAYGGWQMSDVHFHDNYAVDTVYGFNIDSLDNRGVVINHNQIVCPQS
jgi:hypothetical protein